jgi:hypothetical protein
MTNDELKPNDEARNASLIYWLFVIGASSFLLRHFLG